jgi:outer membrane protein, heavy metal efflux system
LVQYVKDLLKLAKTQKYLVFDANEKLHLCVFHEILVYSFIIKQLMRKFFYSLLLFFAAFLDADAQTNDTIRLTLKQAEKTFLEKNLVLLANQANVDVAKAFTEQARLWDNPTVNTNLNVLRFADFGIFDTRQVYVQYQQLFRLGNKRQKLVALQQANERLTEAQFNELLRGLRYTLHTDFYTLQYTLERQQVFQQELKVIQDLLAALRPQAKIGNVAMKDVMRIENIEFGLQQDFLTAQSDYYAALADLKTLLQLSDSDLIQPADADVPRGVPRLLTDSLLQIAKTNRADLQIAALQSEFAQKNLSYQKSLAVPDLTLGGEFDRSGGFANNAINFQVSIPLPIYNKNQGNIKAAEIQIKQNQYLEQNALNVVRQQIFAALAKINLLQATALDVNSAFETDQRTMIRNITQLYQERRVSLVEFADAFDAYTSVILRRLDTRKAYRSAIEELNYQLGQQVF